MVQNEADNNQVESSNNVIYYTAEPVFEPAENGYFFRKMPDGTYDQTVYIQAEDGSYVPYQA